MRKQLGYQGNMYKLRGGDVSQCEQIEWEKVRQCKEAEWEGAYKKRTGGWSDRHKQWCWIVIQV